MVHRERGQEAIWHLFRAFELYERAEYKLRALSDVGEALKAQGHYAASKNAFMLVLNGGAAAQTRASNMIMLLELSALTGDRVGFARWAGQIAAMADEMPPERLADFELQLGRGHALFGHNGKATASLKRALAIAQQYRLNEGAFRAQQALLDLENGTARNRSEDPAAGRAEHSSELVEIAEKLQALRAG